MASIIIVPTSHVAEESIRKVRETISRHEPDCVAVELDMNRFVVMEEGASQSNWEALKRLGPWTFAMFMVMKKLQSWLGKKVGIMPGSDMISAVRAAEEAGTSVAFIDRDIGITLQRIKQVSWREKAKLMLFMFKGLTLDSMLAKSRKDRTGIDLTKVPDSEVIDEVIKVLRKEFPGIYNALLKERNIYMARRIIGLSQRFDKIVAVVGAAHAPGLESLLGHKSGYTRTKER